MGKVICKRAMRRIANLTTTNSKLKDKDKPTPVELQRKAKKGGLKSLINAIKKKAA